MTQPVSSTGPFYKQKDTGYFSTFYFEITIYPQDVAREMYREIPCALYPVFLMVSSCATKVH